jgi:hypothetical protein
MDHFLRQHFSMSDFVTALSSYALEHAVISWLSTLFAVVQFPTYGAAIVLIGLWMLSMRFRWMSRSCRLITDDASHSGFIESADTSRGYRELK